LHKPIQPRFNLFSSAGLVSESCTNIVNCASGMRLWLNS